MQQYIEKTRKKGVHKIGNVYVNIDKLVKDFNRVYTKIKVGGFYCLIPESCRNIQEIEQFKENIEEIIGTKLNEEKMLCLLMIWFLREHMPEKEIYPLLGNSANARYTRIITSNKPYNKIDDEKKSDLIFKFQIKDTADDLVIDILNTRLINKLLTGNIKSSFMVYIESFMTYIDETTNTFNLSKYQTKILEKPDHTPLDLLAVKCMVVENITFNNVHENLSVDSLFKVIKSHNPLNKLQIFSMLNLQLNMLFKHLKIVGELYGFVHNDCHLGNILMNSNNQLVLIDMGRVYFNFYADINIPNTSNSRPFKKQRTEEGEPKKNLKLLEIYEALIVEENQKFIKKGQEPYSFDSIIKKIKEKKTNKKPIYINPFYRIEDIATFPQDKKREDFQYLYDYYVKNMYLFDISTIILNILHYTIIDKECETFESNKETYNFREEVLRIFDKEHEDSDNSSLINNFFISKVNKTEVKIELVIFDNMDNLLSSKFNLGIYIFGIFVLYVIKLSPDYFTEIKLDKTTEDISGDTIVLKRNANNSYSLEIYYTNFVEEIYCMWHSYQYINIPKIYMFYGYFHKHRDMIEKLKPKELSVGQQGGREKCSINNKEFNILKPKIAEIFEYNETLADMLDKPQHADNNSKYNNDTIPDIKSIPDTIPEKSHRFYEVESDEILQNNINKTLYSEIAELFENKKIIILKYNKPKL